MTTDEMPLPVRADVLVIGAGASGAVFARRCAEAGLTVVCLEQGDWMDSGEEPRMVGDRPEWELAARRQWHADPNVRRLAADYPCDVEDSDFPAYMYNAVGGTSVYWAAIWSRLMPSDFRVRTLDGVAQDWPIGYADLAPYYEQVERDFQVSGYAGDPAYPGTWAPPREPFPLNEGAQRIAAGLTKLGWHWWPGTQAISPKAHGHLAGCVGIGTCRLGCPAGAKASTDLTHWPAALRHGARIVTRARVNEITTNSAGLATGATYRDRVGITRHQAADVVVVAANGIGTPRLLLLSANRRHPDGLANSSGQVGRNLMMHPQSIVTGVYEEPVAQTGTPNGEWLRSTHFYESDATRGFTRGAKWIFMPTHGPLSVLGKVELLAARGAGVGYDDLWGVRHHATMDELVGHSIDCILVGDDLPEPGNRVELSDRIVDSAGDPAPAIRYRTSENSRRLLAWHAERAAEAHEAAGAVRTIIVEDFPPAGHLMGTARMGDDPATSVVDSFCRAHDVANLFLVDGSSFVTGSGVNPTATIAALAYRAADHLIASARSQEVPA